MTDYNLSHYPSLGKFEGELNITAYAYSASLDGGGDAEFGSIPECGEHHCCMRGPFEPSQEQIKEHELTADDVAYLRKCEGGVVLSENEQGFVSGEWYDTHEKYQKAVTDLEERFGELDEDDSGDGDDECDICGTSHVNVERTTHCGKRLGIECGCADGSDDGCCNDANCDDCRKVTEDSDEAE